MTEQEPQIAHEMSTQNTQYDAIGTRYLEIKELPAVEAEMPSVLSVLMGTGGGGVVGKKCLGMCCFSPLFLIGDELGGCLWWCVRDGERRWWSWIVFV